MGLLIGAFVLNSSAVPDPNHQATADPPVIEPEVEVEETVSPTPASTTPATVAETQPVPEPTAEEELKSSIQNAIDTIEKKSAQIFVYSYLPFEMRQRYEQVVEREGRSVVDQALSKKVFKEYRIHLQSALNGSVEFNLPQTVAVVKYKLKELPDSGMKLDKFARDDSEIAVGEAYEGLGDDLPSMLRQAAALLEDDKVQEFVEKVYPISELELLFIDPAMSNLMTRINQTSMKAAMIRDLKAAAEAEAEIQSGIAAVTLAPLVKGDSERTFKFDLVEGNWRFTDQAAQERETIRELTVKLPESMKNGNDGLTFIFERTNSDSEWRIKSLPETLMDL